MTRPSLLRMTHRDKGGADERWDVMVEDTGEIIIAGLFPVDSDAVFQACQAYHHRRDEAERIWQVMAHPPTS